MRKLILLPLLFALLPVFASAHGGVDDDELIIRITEQGFSPQELTVTQNDAVLFINNDDVSHWPLFAGNTGTQVAPGSSTKITFPNVGTFHVTDKLASQTTLTVVALPDPANTPVSGEPVALPETQSVWGKIKSFFSHLFHPVQKEVKIDQKLLAEFKNLDDVQKYAWINKIGTEESPEAAWGYVVAAYTTPEGVVGNAHDMAHLVGQLLFKKYGFRGLATCTPTFAFGCYHGVMQVAFDKEKPDEFPAQLAAAQQGCIGVATSTSPSYWSCIHGIGHGVATYRDFDLNTSLSDCDTFGDTISPYCRDGVFMEFSSRAPATAYRATDPLYPCDTIKAEYQTACARAQVQVMKFRFGMKTPAIAAACLKSASQEIRYHCVDALGYGVAQESAGRAEKAIAGCNAISDKAAAAQCLAAAAGEFVFQDMSGWQSSVVTMCETLTGAAHEACEARVENVEKTYGRE